MSVYRWNNRKKKHLGLASALNAIDKDTYKLNQSELHQLHVRGELPTGVYDWLIALRKADIAIPCKNPRQL